MDMPATPQHHTTVCARVTAVLGMVTLFAGVSTLSAEAPDGTPEVVVAGAFAAQGSADSGSDASLGATGEVIGRLGEGAAAARDLRRAHVEDATEQAARQLAEQREQARAEARAAREEAEARAERERADAARREAEADEGGSSSGSDTSSGSSNGTSGSSSSGSGGSSSGGSDDSGSTGSSQPSQSQDSGSCDHECRGQRIAEDLTVRLPDGWTIDFEPSHPNYAGMADPRDKTITLYVSDRYRDETLLWVLYHEAGHAYDFAYMDSGDRQRWADARGYDADPWYPEPGELDYESPAGDWAESFAHCRSGLSGHYRSQMAGAPGSGQCSLMRDLSA